MRILSCVFFALLTLSACASGGGYQRSYIISDIETEPVVSESVPGSR